MSPETPEPSPTSDLFRHRLAELIDWSVFDGEFVELSQQTL